MALKDKFEALTVHLKTLSMAFALLILNTACVSKTEHANQPYNPPNCDAASIEGFKCEDGKITKVDNRDDHIEYYEQLRPLHTRSEIIEQEIKDARKK